MQTLSRKIRRPRSGLWLALSLSLAYFAACLGWVAREVHFVLFDDRITASLSVERALGSTLGWQLALFALAAFLVHLLLGALAYCLARLTEAALPPAASVRRGWLIAGWFMVLVGLVMTANATLHPSSIFAGEESWWHGRIAGVTPIAAATIALAMLVLLLVAQLVRNRKWRWSSIRRCTPVAVATAAIILVSWLPHAPAVVPRDATTSPHVVIIGIDSLRNDLTIPRLGPADAPNIRQFVREARRFNDVTTPLARTYASWMTILTGRHPVTTNARYNLMPRRLVHEGETLGDSLRARGYHVTYATDEVRFANFDKSFGFDRLITPPVGAIDFLLGYAGDMPLVNLVATTPAGGILFPSNHANRAAQVTYRPRDFTRRLEREFQVEGRELLAIHLTLAHWPYSWASNPKPSVPDAYRVAYGMAVNEVDRQFSDVMHVLREKGVLDNAIVVLLSDHGEALGAEDDSIIRKSGTSHEVWDSLWGHGTSVLSPNQYQVLLAVRTYGRARLPGPDQDYDWPVSLEDLRPTLQELVTGTAPADVDGLSLVPYMSDPSRSARLLNRVRFTETDFNTTKTLAGRYEESGLVDEAAVFYELDPDSGWVQLRESRIQELLAQKQRAALSSGSLLAAIPGPQGKPPRLLFAERANPHPRSLDVPPDTRADPEAGRLWRALEARFPGELAAQSAPP